MQICQHVSFYGGIMGLHLYLDFYVIFNEKIMN